MTKPRQHGIGADAQPIEPTSYEAACTEAARGSENLLRAQILTGQHYLRGDALRQRCREMGIVRL